jgi:hypothetical protein
MSEALRSHKREVPPYLEFLTHDSDPRSARLTLAMHCYWDGEAKLGALDGVFTTQAGWANGKEIVDIRYDPKTIALATLIKTAKTLKCASAVFVHTAADLIAAKKLVSDASLLKGEPTKAKESDRKFALGRHALRSLPMTSMQATKVNAALRLGKPYKSLLSPRQLALAERIAKSSAGKKLPNHKGESDMAKAWDRVTAALEKR